MMILERYSTAVNSDNLSSDPRSTWADSDVVAAAGLAAKSEPLGVALIRVFAHGDPTQALAILTDMSFRRARTMRVRLSLLQAGDLAKAVLGWYRHGTCQPCGGTGYKIIPGTPALGDQCPHCQSTGRIDFDRQFTEDVRELARWLSSQIDRSQTVAGRAVMAMVAPTLEL